jgi:hypothetical protein
MGEWSHLRIPIATVSDTRRCMNTMLCPEIYRYKNKHGHMETHGCMHCDARIHRDTCIKGEAWKHGNIERNIYSTF